MGIHFHRQDFSRYFIVHMYIQYTHSTPRGILRADFIVFKGLKLNSWTLRRLLLNWNLNLKAKSNGGIPLKDDREISMLEKLFLYKL